MEVSGEKKEEIRGFLLGQIDDQSSEMIEDQIFTEPDFAEEVRILESELIEDYVKGNLSPAERQLFTNKYLNTPAGTWKVQFEKVLREFAHEKLMTSAAPGVGLDQPSEGEKSASHPRPGYRPDLSERILSFLIGRRVFVYSVIAVCLVLILSLVAYKLISTSGSGAGNLLQAKRRAAEKELSGLNAGTSPSDVREVFSVNLVPAQRDGGTIMPRLVVTDNNSNDVVKLGLSLLNGKRSMYRAVIFDDRQNELFTISGLTPRDTQDGQQVWILVYTRLLPAGDYQIDLTSLSPNGAYEAEGTYPFRLIISQ
ncbi:MAG: hypothetical protein WBV94_12630 [Blastocatellia bacterium]